MDMKWLGMLMLCLLCCSACTPDSWQGEHKHPDAIWTYADSLVVKPEITDTQEIYSVWLELVVTPAFPYRNLYVHQNIIPPGDTAFNSIQEYTLQAEDGTWLQNPGWFGDVQYTVPLLQQFKFQTMGTWTFSLAQFMRTDTLQGVKSVRWYLKKAQG
jgi:gliding motility-associated lipoprotein GldH